MLRMISSFHIFNFVQSCDYGRSVSDDEEYLETIKNVLREYKKKESYVPTPYML